MRRTPGPDSLWRNRNYMYYRTSRVVSNLGSRMTSLAGPLLVLGMGGGAVRAGAVGTCWFIAQTVFQLPGGYLADRFDGRRLMLAMDAVRLLAIGSIPLAGLLDMLTFAQILVVILVESAASVVFSSAASVFLRVVVPREQFSLALSQSHFSAGAISILGPILGGALYGVHHYLPFIVDAGSYVLSGALLLAVSVRSRRSSAESAGDQAADRRASAGLRWLWRHPSTLRVVLFCSLLNLVSAAMGLAVLVVLTESGTSSSVIGIVVGWSGAGVIVGSLVARRALALGRWLYPAVGLIWAGSLAAVAVSASAWVIGAVLTLVAFLGPSIGVMVFQMLRDQTPLDLYGRVVAGQQLIGIGLATIAPLFAGALLAALGGTTFWLVLAGTCLAATTLTIGRSRPPSRAPGGASMPDPAAAAAGGAR